MKEALDKINKRLEEMYPGKKPMISIFGDGSWMVDVDSEMGRIGGELQGDSIESIEEELDIKF